MLLYEGKSWRFVHKCQCDERIVRVLTFLCMNLICNGCTSPESDSIMRFVLTFVPAVFANSPRGGIWLAKQKGHYELTHASVWNWGALWGLNMMPMLGPLGGLASEHDTSRLSGQKILQYIVGLIAVTVTPKLSPCRFSILSATVSCILCGIQSFFTGTPTCTPFPS